MSADFARARTRRSLLAKASEALSVASSEGHERARAQGLFADPGLRLVGADQVARPSADGHQEDALGRELVEERRRQSWRRGGYEDPVVGRERRVSQGAVAEDRGHVVG